MSDRTDRRWPWMLSFTGVLTVSGVVAALGLVALVAMLWIAAGAPAAERAKLQIDAIKWGIGLFAASGAVAALLLNVRRQRHLEYAQEHVERAQRHTERDAAERRVTDLYTKAVEQLGHEKAAVRLGGLRALERVGQDNVKQRQIVIDVICAYLRMPYDANFDEDREAYQEGEVRITAERVIKDHIRVPAEMSPEECVDMTHDPDRAFWPGIDVNLAGAVLLRPNFDRCLMRRATFDGARFTRPATFVSTTFVDDAGFSGAIFADTANFRAVDFRSVADFGVARFSATVEFQSAHLPLGSFAATRFEGDAHFADAVFNVARFDAAAFAKRFFFNGARCQDATFQDTAFGGLARLPSGVDLSGARARLPREPGDVWPDGWIVADEPDQGWAPLARKPAKD